MEQQNLTPPRFVPVEKRIAQVCTRLPEPEFRNVVLKHLVKHINDLMVTDANHIFRKNGLNHVSFSALLMLYRAELETINPSGLSEVTGESRANVTRICDDLVAKGLLIRDPNPEDRRRIDLRLAPAGAELMEALLPHMRDRLCKAFACFSDEEKVLLEGLLKRLLSELYKMDEQVD
ncbi:MarR family transcriptional regulator [Burkholderiaceae bacterium DAT-1]|nr:MarR family transcriptional regulator [Burkholderiaceae bacterium DAT-1]